MEGINTVTNNLLEKTYNCELHTTFNDNFFLHLYNVYT